MFAPKKHLYAVPFQGDRAAAFDVAKTALLALGFEIKQLSETELHAEGPGMHSNQQPDLLGVSSLQLQISQSNITATALLGAAAKMKAFIYLFPPGLAIILMASFALSGMDVSWVHMLWVLPWFVLSPLMGKSFENKAIRAVERLVRGMAQTK